MPARTMKAIAVVGDLFFQSRIRQTADLLGLPIDVVGSQEAFEEALNRGEVGLVIVDLGARSFDPIAALALARAHGAPRSVAFVAHVDEAARRRAEEAGCDEVLPKSAFTRDLAQILTTSLAN